MNKLRSSPARVTVVVAAAALAVYGAMFLARDLLHLAQWFGAWAAVVAFSVVTWAVLFVYGVDRVRQQTADEPRPWWKTHTAAYVLVAVLTSALMGSVTYILQIPAAEDARPAILVAGVVAWLAGYPWVVSVWLAHAEATAIGDDVMTRVVDDLGFATALGRIVENLERTWETIERSSLALAVILSTIVLDVVTLRAAWLAAGSVTEDDLPTAIALGYGAFFAVIVAAIVVPLVVSWRTQAIALVDKVVPFPVGAVPAEADFAARARFERRLGLQSHTLRNPITLLSVFAPVLTGAVSSLFTG
jgi:hypothetical protein